MKKYLILLFLFFFIWHPKVKGSGPDPFGYGGNTTQLPPCLEEHLEDVVHIKTYLTQLKKDAALRKELTEKIKHYTFFTETLLKKKKAGNEKKSYQDLAGNEGWRSFSEEVCKEVYEAAGKNYVQTILSDLFSSDCRDRVLNKAIQRLKPDKGDFPSGLTNFYNYSTVGLAAITEGWLCATDKDKCEGKDYWNQYTYGVLHGAIEQADILAVTDLVVEIIQSQYQNRWSCLGSETSFKINVGSENAIEETVHVLLKCGLGVDINLDDIQKRFALTKDYIKNNWQEPYFRGEATVFIATLVLPSTNKAIGLAKKGILTKLKSGVSSFSKEITTLEALNAAEGKVDEIAKVMKGANPNSLISQIDNVISKLTGKTKYSLANTGEYKLVGGHHPLAKKAFEGDIVYDYQKAFSVKTSALDDAWKTTNSGIPQNLHAKITGQQNSLYTAWKQANPNVKLTINVMADIEIQAMKNIGIPEDIATGWVVKALEDLKAQGVTEIKNIPWNGTN